MRPATITWNGMTKTWAEWAEWMGIKDHERGASTLRGRRKKGWPLDKIFTTPVRSWVSVAELDRRVER